MSFDLQKLLNGPAGLRLAAFLGQRLPPRLGYACADFVAGRIAGRRRSALVRAIRANQWVVRGEPAEPAALDRAVRETLQQSARSIFDLYHYLHDAEASRRLIVYDAVAEALARRPELADRGLMIAGLHVSSFDLALEWLCRAGLKPLILTLPDPRGGQRLEYERRRQDGLNMVPASVGAFRQAVAHLQQGGLVLTGIDRPVAEAPVQPLFFGRPAALPTHHIFLATKADVPVIIMAAHRRADGVCQVSTSAPIEMDRLPDRKRELLHNAEKVLRVAEDFLRPVPQQWSVSLPVWPAVVEQVPV